MTQYLIESSFCLLAFYGFYYFSLRGETFFQLNRLYLLGAALLSLAIPLLNIMLAEPAPAPDIPVEFEQMLYPAVSEIRKGETMIWNSLEVPAPGFSFTLADLFLLLYLLGAAKMGVVLVRRLWSLSQMIRHSRRQKTKGYTLIHADKDFPSASFLGYVFWNVEELKEKETVLQHELVHIRQWHSLDVLLMELMVVIYWFNPLIYLYRSSLRTTHEYIADQYVVRRSGQAYEYAGLLVRQTAAKKESRLMNTFNSLIKKRLMMLNQHPSKSWKSLKYFFVLPILASLMLLFSFNLSDELSGTEQNQKTVFPLDNYTGTWVNVDPNTGGIIKIDITVEDTEVYIHAYGSCRPEPCDMGRIRATAYSSGIGQSPEKNTEAIHAEYRTGPEGEIHIINNLIITLRNPSKLEVRELTKYTDDSGRNNQVDIYHFEKAK